MEWSQTKLVHDLLLQQKLGVLDGSVLVWHLQWILFLNLLRQCLPYRIQCCRYINSHLRFRSLRTRHQLRSPKDKSIGRVLYTSDIPRNKRSWNLQQTTLSNLHDFQSDTILDHLWDHDLQLQLLYLWRHFSKLCAWHDRRPLGHKYMCVLRNSIRSLSHTYHLYSELDLMDDFYLHLFLCTFRSSLHIRVWPGQQHSPGTQTHRGRVYHILILVSSFRGSGLGISATFVLPESTETSIPKSQRSDTFRDCKHWRSDTRV